MSRSLFYSATKGIELLIRFGYGVDPNNLPPVNELRERQYCIYTLGALLLIAFTYGCSRAERFHPGDRSWLRPCKSLAMADFLRTTPWTASKRLPWGSPFLSWVDVPIVASIMFVAAFEIPDPVGLFRGIIIVPAAFAAGYASFAIRLETTRTGGLLSVAIVFLLPLMLICVIRELPLVLYSVVMLLTAHFSLRESLKGFPLWKDVARPARNLGWPFHALAPSKRQTPKTDMMTTVVCCIVVCWVGWAAAVLVIAIRDLSGEPLVPRESAVIVMMLGIALTFFCQMSFLFQGVSIPVLSRFKTGTWIIPKTDGMFASSLVILVLAALGAVAILTDLIIADILIPPLLMAMTAAALLIGPNPSDWQLTCQGNLRAKGGPKFKKQPTLGE